MTPAEALADIRGLARGGRVSYARHAIERMDERGVTRHDVEHALMNAARCAWQPRKETWKASALTYRAMSWWSRWSSRTASSS